MSSNERRLEHTVVVAVYASRSGERQAMRRLQDSPGGEPRPGSRFGTNFALCFRIALQVTEIMEHALVNEGALPESTYEQVCIQEVIRNHHDSLIKFLRRRLCIAEDAYDVAQEAYIRMMKYDGSCEIKSPSAMLFRIAVNVANDHGRASQARSATHHVQIDDVDVVSEFPSAERTVAARQDLDLLLDVIDDLPPKCRQVFLLSRARGMTYPEIARHCGISVKMVEKQISRALAACLKKVGGIDGMPS